MAKKDETKQVEMIGNSRGHEHGEVVEVTAEQADDLIREGLAREGLAREPRKAAQKSS